MYDCIFMRNYFFKKFKADKNLGEINDSKVFDLNLLKCHFTDNISDI